MFDGFWFLELWPIPIPEHLAVKKVELEKKLYSYPGIQLIDIYLRGFSVSMADKSKDFRVVFPISITLVANHLE